MSDESYDPATRPPGDIPGGDHVTFEREGQHEQHIFGGGAQDIAESILKSTERNVGMIGWTITGVTDVVGDMGKGTLQELTLMIQNKSMSKLMKITGIGLHVEIS